MQNPKYNTRDLILCDVACVTLYAQCTPINIMIFSIFGHISEKKCLHNVVRVLEFLQNIEHIPFYNIYKNNIIRYTIYNKIILYGVHRCVYIHV